MKLTKYTTIPLLAAILAGVAVEATPHQQVDIVQASTTKNQELQRVRNPVSHAVKRRVRLHLEILHKNLMVR
ncbi:hypothetical protein [Lactobacillus paragasseri]|uniref:hypothetical protein n=1 Tax=Lactobacillus paragasseri TaxID=2107999 RepID=UPI00217DF7FE|nr:hypothetical protein [Lactobacillus paragasseri]UWI43533.1 hypothetical protein HR119_04770 [Lactobacillus paragasseri]UWI44776.1 hypothetical protein HR117_02050 [Lactobacillus paragasseri]